VTPGFQEEEIVGKAYDWQLLTRLWPYLSPYRALFGLSLFLSLPRVFLGMAPGLLIAIGLNQLLSTRSDAEVAHGLGRLSDAAWVVWLATPPASVDVLLWLALLLLGAAVVNGGIELARMISMAVMGQRAMRDLRRHLFDHVQRLPMAFFDRYPVGRLVTRLSNDVESLAEMFTAGAVAMVADLVFMAVLATMLFYAHTRMAMVAMAIVPVMAVAAIVFRWKVRDAFRQVRVKIARINATLQETISGMKVVQLFARERRNLRDFSEMNADHRNAWFRSIRYDAMLFATVDVSQNLTIALILWYGAGQLGSSSVEPGLFFLFVDWMRRFFQPLQDLSARYSVMQSSMASCERIFQLLDTPVEASEAPDVAAKAREKGWGEGAVSGEVVFDDVSFAYGDEPVLRNLSFRVAPGERVALVGHTGAGKTTVLKLLERLYEPQQGSIRIDGVDVRDLPRAELRRHISFVLQDVFLFNGDLRYNLALGRSDISEADVAEAARTTHVDELVARLPQGYGQQVSERGVNFSTGERQLLSFARALARRPEILLLDEATANVDTETEAKIQDALHRLMEGKTSIVVAHRLSTIQDVDRIYVLHHGELREQGTHEELLAQRGLYWKLYRLQYADQARRTAA